MKRQSLYAILLPLAFTSCSSDDNNGEKRETNELTGMTFYLTEERNGANTYTFGDTEFQKVYNALNYLPTDKYETSWDYKDTLLTLSYSETTNLKLSFVSDKKASLDEKKTNVSFQQPAVMYHHYYRFHEDYYAETSIYMLHITSYTFDYYDKRANERTSFRLNSDRCYNLYFYMKKGITKQETTTDSTHYAFDYQRDSQNKLVTFTDNKGNSAYGHTFDMENISYTGKVFNLYYNDGMYSMYTTELMP